MCFDKLNAPVYEAARFHFLMYLVGAPVPSGQYGQPQCHSRPGQVSGDSVSEQVHGVVTWQVTRTVGNDPTGHRHAVHSFQVTIPSNLIKGYGPETHNLH